MLRGPVALDGILFEWDPEKAESNFRKHKVTFEEASSIFGDPLSITIPDPAHSRGEERVVTIGWSDDGRTLVVVHLDLDESIRIISARVATRRERRQYEEGKEGQEEGG
jgi:uncharacterized DUF497 family protein